jgi:hypothetical protein
MDSSVSGLRRLVRRARHGAGGRSIRVEDWRSYPIGTRGVPNGWMRQTWNGWAGYDFEIVADSGQPVLQLRSRRDSSTISRHQKAPTVTYVILRSGGGELGKWITERRNVVEDFLRIYGEQPENPSALSLSIDSDETVSSAESFIGPIIFTGP